MRLRGKCSPVNLMHIFETIICKNTTWGLLVGGVVSTSAFLTRMHVYIISFDRINTVFLPKRVLFQFILIKY